MLRHLLIHVEDREESSNGQEAIYKIKLLWQLLASYIGKTGRNLNTRLTEYKRAMRYGDANNHIAAHYQLTNHNTSTDWKLPNLQNKVISMTDSGKLVH